MKDLEPATTYNVRAYVKTSEGTTYGPVSQMQSKKPCVLTGFTQKGNSNGILNISLDAQNKVTGVGGPGGTHTLTYNTDGLLVKYELKSFSINATEIYSYSLGKVSKIEYQAGTIHRNTNYEYDAQGKLIKETVSLGGVTTEYIYTQGVLADVKANNGTTFKVKDGNVIEINNGNGNYSIYEYDARGNQTKSQSFANGKQTISFEYSFDDKPNFGFGLINFEGWLPNQISKGAFMGMTPSGRHYNNWTEFKFQSTTSQATSTRVYSYDKNRVIGYTDKQIDTVNGIVLYNLTYTLTYTGDCNN